MKFEHTEVFNFEGAIRGMRNPMDSWGKSDSHSFLECECFFIGGNDLNLAQSLSKAGGEHRKYLRQIFVSVDISAPRYWWAEFDTYKIGTVANSCSTMHTLTRKAITSDMFELDYVDEFDSNLISHLDTLRCLYNETKDIKYFRKLKQLLPESFIQKRTVTMNYENILNMINQRSAHKLKEWSVDFIKWAKSLSYANSLLFLEESK